MGDGRDIFQKYFEAKDPLATDFEVDGSDIYGSLLGDA